MLLHALSKGDATPLAANALQAAVWAQPCIAALVCLGRGDKGGAARALVECTSAEQARILATFSVEWRALDMRWRYSTQHKPTQAKSKSQHADSACCALWSHLNTEATG